MRFSLLALALFVALSGCRSTAVGSSDTADSRRDAPLLYDADEVPTGTPMDLRLNDTIGTEMSEVGDLFYATVLGDLRTRDGRTVIPAGSRVMGRVTELDDSDGITDQAALRVEFDEITIRGRRHPFAATILEMDIDEDRETSLGRSAARGAVLGAIIGGVLGGRDGAAEGAARGAVGSTALNAVAGDVELTLEAGTRLRVETARRIDLR